MKLETSQTFGNGTYVLSDKEIAAMITEVGATPSSLSPLAAVDLSVVARKTPDDFTELREALTTLCAPETTVDIRTWPDGGSWVSFYGPSASGAMAAYSRNDAGANMIVWPMTAGMLKSMISAPLADAPADPKTAPGFVLSFDELLALASLIDCQQETLWRALADRDPSPEIRVTAADLERCYDKGLRQSDDPRWMVSRLVQGLSLPLPAKLPQAEVSLARFADIRMVIEDTDGFAPLPSTGLVFQQLAEIEGFAAVTLRMGQGKPTQRRLYQTNRAQTWAISLAGDDDMPDKATLNVLSGDALSADLDALLSAGAAAPEAAPVTEAPPATSEAVLRCRACGAENLAGQNFCSSCGANLAAAEPAKATCGKCGATLAPGVKFCTRCGHRVERS
ncbi:zinc ribbon domain-containing protein [Marimonas arenosa]|uniref:Zinc ribbon domain-containing protein n=1 Tax=Marimonas arenosa TaxID=1795305 RepID=A0AAE3WBU7_9RHOB|nr:zinc ribbon domain-containing protein [Marimonas arenosa]MDQ2090071.1 zinc ribbon domain-containing protein [Marimonas arenosa]